MIPRVRLVIGSMAEQKKVWRYILCMHLEGDVRRRSGAGETWNQGERTAMGTEYGVSE
jgi:hypothetical protein